MYDNMIEQLGSFTVRSIHSQDDGFGFVIEGYSLSAFGDTLEEALHSFGELLQIISDEREDIELIINNDR